MNLHGSARPGYPRPRRRRPTIECGILIPKPCHVRLSRSDTPTWREPDLPFEIGAVEVRRARVDLTIASTGILLGEVLEAADILPEEDGLSVEVLNVYTIKPLDGCGVLASGVRTGAIITVEEHSVICGPG